MWRRQHVIIVVTTIIMIIAGYILKNQLLALLTPPQLLPANRTSFEPARQVQSFLITRPESLRELVRLLTERYREMEVRLQEGVLDEVLKAALEMAAHAKLVPQLSAEIPGLSVKEQDRIASLAHALQTHAVEVYRSSSTGDLDGSRIHLQHVLSDSYKVLRSGLSLAIQQELKQNK